jgi:UDP-N-acetyl-D-glucosamine dehydrogenase
MPYICADKIASALNEHEKAVCGSRVAIIGVSYKPGVGDLRESRVLKIMRILRARGAELVYHDAHVPELPDFDLKSAALEQVPEGADTAAILTAHPGLDVERILATAPLVVDFRGVTRGIEAPHLVRL